MFKKLRDKIKSAINKISEEPIQKISTAITTSELNKQKFDELFWELELALLENNVAVEVIDTVRETLQGELVNKRFNRKELPNIVKESLKKSLRKVLLQKKINLLIDKKPFIILLVGINGSGKTTTIAKLTNYFQKHNKTVVVAASDTFRAAAIQQLQTHINKLGATLIKQDYGADPAAVAYDAIKHAQSKSKDIVLIDTAGRMHSNNNLMDELKKIVRVAKPDLTIFVGESTTGNDCIQQAQAYDKAIGIDGIILTKADVDDSGGAAVSIGYVTKKPIIFLGVGQELDDLKEYNPDDVINKIF